MLSDIHDRGVKITSTDMEEMKNLSNEGYEEAARFSVKETRKLLWKIDLTILPLVSVMYLLSFLDRSNIGNARLAGLEKDLGMTGWDYAVSRPCCPLLDLFLKTCVNDRWND